jgi:hypothetical protein
MTSRAIEWRGFMKYAVDMVSGLYIPSSMKIGTGVQAILRFRLVNFRVCNVGTADGTVL